jgi:ribosomal protein S18 acetylase RimI-like enzyme
MTATATAPDVAIQPADLSQPTDRAAVVAVLDAYARDPMGGGAPLAPAVAATLPDRLAAVPHARVWLARDAAGTPVGVAVCFIGFSTFAAQPLLNLHDLAVLASHRGRGIGRQLLATIEAAAAALGCCKVTLEVRDDNTAAQRLYRAVGYGDGAASHRFWSKQI